VAGGDAEDSGPSTAPEAAPLAAATPPAQPAAAQTATAQPAPRPAAPKALEQDQDTVVFKLPGKK